MRKVLRVLVPYVLAVLTVLGSTFAAAPKTHRLEATPTTVAYGCVHVKMPKGIFK